MNLKTLIERLARENPDRVVAFGFGAPGSWRGDYAELAFEPAKNVTIGSMLANARAALGATYEGYKGGRFKMGEYTTCHVARYGECDLDGEDTLTLYMLCAMLASTPIGIDHGDPGGDCSAILRVCDEAEEERE